MNERQITINGKTYDVPETERDAFTFYRTFLNAIEYGDDATVEQKFSLLMAILNYAFEFKEPDQQTFSNMGRFAWKLIAPNITSGIIPFLNGAKGGKFGKLGGAPKGSHNNPNGRRGNKELTPKLTPKLTPNKNKNKEDKERLTNVSPKKGELSLHAPSEKFLEFMAWLKEQCPNVAKMEVQMTEGQLNTLLEKFGKNAVWRILRSMENYKPLTKKNRSVYLSALNWLNRDTQKGGQR